MAPGEAIPSESELAIRFNVSQGTVRKAIDELAAENLLLRRQGKGTFVASHDDPRAFFRFCAWCPLPVASSKPRAYHWSAGAPKAGPEVARMLELNIGDPINIVRDCCSSPASRSWSTKSTLPGSIFGTLTLEMLRDFEGSLYSFFENRFGVRMIRAEERLRAVPADRASAELLRVSEGSPLLSVERVSFSYGDKPVEWRRGLYLTSEHCYFNELG
jgi:GntR family transcriptional regulator